MNERHWEYGSGDSMAWDFPSSRSFLFFFLGWLNDIDSHPRSFDVHPTYVRLTGRSLLFSASRVFFHFISCYVKGLTRNLKSLFYFVKSLRSTCNGTACSAIFLMYIRKSLGSLNFADVMWEGSRLLLNRMSIISFSCQLMWRNEF